MGPTDEFERAARLCGYRRIAGVDEVGRGPLAGPVVAAAVILPVRSRLSGVNDSKQLSERDRERFYSAIREQAVGTGIGWADVAEIDQLNILVATRLAMRRALEQLVPSADYVLIDAVTLPGVSIPVRPIIKGDSLSISIAAASIVAKVTRDRLMASYHDTFPEYGFRSHKGYGTAEHLERLAHHGPCSIHRRSFAPVKLAMGTRKTEQVRLPNPTLPEA
jgi:ribonuclease HII